MSNLSESEFTKEINRIIPVLSENNASVLLYGEKGTGKNYIATRIHLQKSGNLDHFFEINCKTFDVNQIAEVLKKIEAADNLNHFCGERFTLFLGCINNLSVSLQEKIVKIINDYKKRGLNFKIICSAEDGLEQKVAAGEFLEALFVQINSIVINILPLRQRIEDICCLAEYFRKLYCGQTGLKFESFSESAMELLKGYFFSGNIDELKNIIQHAFIVGETPVIKASDFGIACSEAGSIPAGDIKIEDKSLKAALDAFKKEYVTRILEENGWNQTKSAKILGIQRTYVIRLINELHIRRK